LLSDAAQAVEGRVFEKLAFSNWQLAKPPGKPQSLTTD